MRWTNRTWLHLGSAAAAFGCAHAAQAQQAPTPSALDEVVVTARGFAEVLADVPDTVSVMSSAAIEKKGVSQLKDVALSLVNVGISESLNAGSSFVSVRAVNAVRNSDPSVAIVLDGVQIDNPNEVSQTLFDVERIEVLRGPQGALYGRGAIGGAINIVTKRPTNTLSAQAEATLGHGGEVSARGSVSGAIIPDKVQFRLAGFYRDFDGLIYNPEVRHNVDFSKDRAVKAELILKPSDALTVQLRASYDDLKAGTYYFIGVFDAGFTPLVDRPNDFSLSPRSDNISVDHRKLQNYALKGEYDAGGFTLAAILAYSNTDDRYGVPGEGVGSDGPGDLDFTPLPIWGNAQYFDIDAYTAEVRATSTGDGPLKWTAGYYHLRTDRDDRFDLYISQNLGGYFGNAALGRPLVEGLDPTAPIFLAPFGGFDTTGRNEANAVFAQASYDLNDRWNLTLAGRYDRDHKRLRNNLNGVTRSITFDSFQPKGSLSYRISDDNMVFATVSKGFRSGGFNPPGTTYVAAYDAERLWNYELGAKTAWLDRTLKLNLALFYNAFDNSQQFKFDGATGTQVIYNIPKSDVLGFETDVTWRTSVEGLTLNAGLGLMDSKIKRFDAAAAGFPPGQAAALSAVKGNKLPVIYHTSASLGVDYERPLNDGLDLTLSATYSGKGDQYWYLDNTNKARWIDLVDARIGLEAERGWGLFLWGKNLLNTHWYSAYESSLQTDLPQAVAWPQQGRTYGVTARVKY